MCVYIYRYRYRYIDRWIQIDRYAHWRCVGGGPTHTPRESAEDRKGGIRSDGAAGVSLYIDNMYMDIYLDRYICI